MFFLKRRKRKKILDFINLDGKNIMNIDKEYLKDDEVCLLAIMRWEPAFQFIDKSLKNNKDFCLMALNINKEVFKYFTKKMRMDDDVVSLALNFYGTDNFRYLPSELKFIKKYALQAFLRNKTLYPKLCKRFREDNEFCVSLVYEGWTLISHFPKDKLTTNLCDFYVCIHPQELSEVEDKVSLETIKKLYYMQKISIHNIPIRYISEFISSEDDAFMVLRRRPKAISFIPKEFLTEFVIRQFTIYIRHNNIVSKLTLSDLIHIPLEFLIEYSYKKDLYDCLKKSSNYNSNNQEIALLLLKISCDFLDFFNVTNETLFEAIKYNDEVLTYVMDEKFKNDLENALINDSLEGFKERHPEHFSKNGKTYVYHNSLIKELRKIQKSEV